MFWRDWPQGWKFQSSSLCLPQLKTSERRKTMRVFLGRCVYKQWVNCATCTWAENYAYLRSRESAENCKYFCWSLIYLAKPVQKKVIWRFRFAYLFVPYQTLSHVAQCSFRVTKSQLCETFTLLSISTDTKSETEECGGWTACISFGLNVPCRRHRWF